MKIGRVNNVAFMQRGFVNKNVKPIRKAATYTMLGLMSLAATSCCVSIDNSQQNKNTNDTTITETLKPRYETNNSQTPAHEVGLNDKQKNALIYVFKNAYKMPIKLKEDNERNKLKIVNTNPLTDNYKYDAKYTEEGVVFTTTDSKFFNSNLRIIEIKNLNNGGFTVSISGDIFEFDKNGNIIPKGAINTYNQALKFREELDNVKILDNTNKEMLAYVITSMNINNIDVIEQNGYVELYGESNDASYQFIVRKGKDNSVYGIANKMLASANLQTETSNGSSEMYAFKCTDKSTDNTKRMQFTSMRVVQSNIDNPSDTQTKYGERTAESHVVGDYKVARGLLGGADIMATNEKTFTTKYLSEGAENRMYTLDDKGWLKINGQYPFSTKL